LVQSEPQAKELISEYVADIIGEFSILAQCIKVLALYTPWAWTWDADLAARAKDLNRDYAENGESKSGLIADIQAAFPEGIRNTNAVALSELNRGIFRYPIEKRRTKENVEVLYPHLSPPTIISPDISYLFCPIRSRSLAAEPKTKTKTRGQAQPPTNTDEPATAPVNEAIRLVWQFQPKNIDVERNILFHEPHPRGKLPYTVARWCVQGHTSNILVGIETVIIPGVGRVILRYYSCL
jgi:hypothetical protein